MIREVYSILPEPAKPVAKSIYDRVTSPNSSGVRDEFVRTVFEDRKVFERYCSEFDDSVADIQSARMEEFYEMVPEDQVTFGGMNRDQARSLYAIVRSEMPAVIVETGVCNGVSTFVTLMAMEKNEAGVLYSIDYPTFSDDPAPEFQQEQYPDDHTFSAIPKDKTPGWVVPDDLRNRWELQTGKSQRKLPPLLTELEEIDMFIHDSDHTFPCMMFEYEVAWEFLRSNGILLSDDIHANDAFEVFGKTRAGQYGEACSSFGYALKPR